MYQNFFVYGLDYFIITCIITIILAFIIDIVIKKIFKKRLLKNKEHLTTNEYLLKTIRFIIWLLALIVIFKQITPLNQLGNTILGATGLIAIAVGIAAQATFGNYIAGFFLAIHKPFKVDDIIYIKERGLSGTVEDITFRHTVLRTQEHTHIIIPNTFMNTAIIENMSNETYSRIIELAVDKNTNLNNLQKIIDKIVKKEELIFQDREYKINIKEITKDGYIVTFPIYVKSIEDYTIVKNHILPKIHDEFTKNKIKMI